MNDLFSGEMLRDAGMARAIEHAEDVAEGWGDRAYRYVERFAQIGGEFRTEQVRQFAEKNGLEKPPHDRAWGSVIAKAARRRLILLVRYEPCRNPKAHSCPVKVWKGART